MTARRPYRGRGRGRGRGGVGGNFNTSSEAIASNSGNDAAPLGNAGTVVGFPAKNDNGTCSYLIKVSNMPEAYKTVDFMNFVSNRFKVNVQSVISPALNNPWVVLEMANKEDLDKLMENLPNHLWRMKRLDAVLTDYKPEEAYKEISNEDYKIVLDSLPLLDIPYEQQNRLSVEDAELMAKQLHASLCAKNNNLLGWAEATCEKNGGFLFKIEQLKLCRTSMGYKNKCKFRIGRNSQGLATVGFMNDTNDRILGVEPGDKFIHLPDSMKYAAKKFQEFMRGSGRAVYDKATKSGTFDNLMIRVAPDGALMLVAIVAPCGLGDAGIESLKNDLRAYFETGPGMDCNVFSLYLQIFQEHQPNYPDEKLHLLLGKPNYEENICGLKFYVSPFSILNINPSSSENIYNSVIELAEPTPDSIVIDVCAGSCGIAFTLANKVEQAYAIERKIENVIDAQKTKVLNNITNVEIISGKCEDHLEELFNKLRDKKKLIVVLDPPRNGVVAPVVALIRKQQNVKKVIYVCSNSKTGLKNFLDFASKEGRNPSTGQLMFGLPFLPIKGIPIDVAPFTANNTITLLLERVNPGSFPPAKKPVPKPMPMPENRKRAARCPTHNGQVKKRRPDPSKNRSISGGSGSGGGGSRMERRMERVANYRQSQQPSRPLMCTPTWKSPSFRPPPQMPPTPPPQGRNFVDQSIIDKYERRIAELEHQNRTYQQSLAPINQQSMAAMNQQSMAPMNQQSMAPMNQPYQAQSYNDDNMSDPWINSPKYSNTNSQSRYGSHATDNNYRSSNSGPFGDHVSYRDDPIPAQSSHNYYREDRNSSNDRQRDNGNNWRPTQNRGSGGRYFN